MEFTCNFNELQILYISKQNDANAETHELKNLALVSRYWKPTV